jgi:hypothetical protein
MDVISDETAVRRMFDDLTAGQPDAPADRHGRIKRKVFLHRVTQAIGTFAVIGAATALAVGIGTSAHGVAPNIGPRPAPAWSLPWPDHRNGSVPQRVLNGAVLAWRHQAAAHDGTPLSATANARVTWYVGQTVAAGEVVAVVFEADSAAGKRLVAGWAMASAVMHGQPGTSPGSSVWLLYDVAAPRPSRGLFIGLNMPGRARPGRNPDNWIAVLAAPDVRGVGFTVAGPSTTKTNSQGTTSSSSTELGMAPADHGLAVADIGQIGSPVQVTSLNVGNRNTLASPADVGVPGSAASHVPLLAAPGAVRGGQGFARVLEFTGQGVTSSDLTGISGRLAVRARCDGPGPLRILLGYGSARDLLELAPSAARTRLRPLGSVACDDRVHELVTSVRLTSVRNRGMMIIDGARTAVYRVDLGTAPKR